MVHGTLEVHQPPWLHATGRRISWCSMCEFDPRRAADSHAGNKGPRRANRRLTSCSALNRRLRRCRFGRRGFRWWSRLRCCRLLLRLRGGSIPVAVIAKTHAQKIAAPTILSFTAPSRNCHVLIYTNKNERDRSIPYVFVNFFTDWAALARRRVLNTWKQTTPRFQSPCLHQTPLRHRHSLYAQSCHRQHWLNHMKLRSTGTPESGLLSLHQPC